MTGNPFENNHFMTPWKAFAEIGRLLSMPYVYAYLALSGVTVGNKPRIFGKPIIQRHRQSIISIGGDVILRSTSSSNPLAPFHPVFLSTRKKGAIVQIGDQVGITGGTICADTSIIIGDRVWIGANCIIVDTDFHPLDPTKRLRAPLEGDSIPVRIEDDVFIGMRSIVLKGVKVGRGSVIGAGSVVTQDVPAGVVVAGNPARAVKTL